jgi:hypothetical protein
MSVGWRSPVHDHLAVDPPEVAPTRRIAGGRTCRHHPRAGGEPSVDSTDAVRAAPEALLGDREN